MDGNNEVMYAMASKITFICQMDFHGKALGGERQGFVLKGSPDRTGKVMGFTRGDQSDRGKNVIMRNKPKKATRCCVGTFTTTGWQCGQDMCLNGKSQWTKIILSPD